MPELGLVIVDEEHDHSFKQQEGLRYSARDLAIVRAKRRDVPAILGSATPTLELLKHCEDGSYTRLALPKRAGGASPPRLRLVDLNRHPPTEGLAAPLEAAIDEHLRDGGQAVITLAFEEHCVMGVSAHDARGTFEVRLDRDRPVDEVLKELGYVAPEAPAEDDEAFKLPESRVGRFFGNRFGLFKR